MWKASAPSSSALDIDMKAIPSDPTVIDFPVHWPLIKSPLFNFIMIYVYIFSFEYNIDLPDDIAIGSSWYACLLIYDRICIIRETNNFFQIT